MTNANTLPYADTAAKHGVICESTAEGMTIRIPSPRTRKILLTGVPASIFITQCMMSAWDAFRAWQQGRSLTVLFWQFLAVMSVSLAICGIFAGITAHGLRRGTTIFASAQKLTIIKWSFMGLTHRLEWNRDQIADVTYGAISRCLVIRIRGQDMIQFRPIDDDLTMQWLAKTLHDAMWPTDEAAQKAF